MKSKEFFRSYCKVWAMSFLMLCVAAAMALALSLSAKAAPAPAKTAGVLPKGSVAYAFSEDANLVKTSGDYKMARTVYSIDDKPVLVIDIYYRQYKTIFKAVYYNAVSADGAISFSEREIADTDNVIYIDDNNLGLEKGQVVYAEIQGLLDEVGY